MPARVVRSRARVTTTETATSARLGALRSLERGGVAPRRDASPAEKKVAGPLLTEAMGSCSSKPGEGSRFVIQNRERAMRGAHEAFPPFFPRGTRLDDGGAYGP